MLANSYIPGRLFFTRGVGVHGQRLQSYEMALRRAGVAHLNLVQVSSICPPGAKIISAARGLEAVSPGQIVFVVQARAETNEPNRLCAASIGLATPADRTQYGYLSEHHSYGETKEKVSDYAEDLAASMLATTLGIEFDPDQDYDERKEIFRMSGRIVNTRSITQTARGNKHGRWTTVIALAVLLP
jgi:arginine decarboxylase